METYYLYIIFDLYISGNIYYREMEAFDGKNLKQSDYDQGCRDIAAQLIDNNSFIDV